MSIKKYFPKHKIIFKKYKWCLLLFLIFLLHFFLRFYQLETKSLFGWDQVDNAWVAKNIIIDHKIPLIEVSIQDFLKNTVKLKEVFYPNRELAI